MDAADIVTKHLDVWTSGIERRSAAGRSRSKKFSLYGIEKLRALVLDLAVRGKLVSQDSHDEPSWKLVERFGATRRGGLKSFNGNASHDSDQAFPFSIPKGWCWSQLGLITNYGQTDKANPGEVEPDTWILELEDVEKGTSRLFNKIRYSDRAFQSQKNRFQRDDVIYGKLRPYLDKVLVADEDGVCTTEMVPIRAFPGLAPQYLRLFLKSPFFINLATNSTHGMNLPRLGTEKAREAPFALPPLPEQHRIIAKVHELMMLCDALEAGTHEAIEAHETLVETLLGALTKSKREKELKENWALLEVHFDTVFTTESSIDKLKSCILQLGVMGKLVAQNERDESAAILLKHICTEIQSYSKSENIRLIKPEDIDVERMPFSLPKSWKWTRLSELFNVITDGDHQPPPRADDGVAFLTIGNVTTGTLNFDDCRLVPQEYFRSLAAYRTPAKGDILYTVVGATFGRPAIVETDREFCVQRHIAILKPVKHMDLRFTAWLLASPLVYEQASKSTTGTARPTIALHPLRNFAVPLPPLAEQRRISRKIDQLFGVCDEFKSQVARLQAEQIVFADAIAFRAVS